MEPMQPLHGAYAAAAWILCSRCMDPMQPLHGTYAAAAWNLCNRCMNPMQPLHGTYAAAARILCRRCMEPMQALHGSYAVAAWILCSRCDRSSDEAIERSSERATAHKGHDHQEEKNNFYSRSQQALNSKVNSELSEFNSEL